ncbi:DNA translocase FtsK [Lysinibacillus xylanilyticus]|uniref:FtsK gamma domain-containing protein n=1 Tax=Lysinibacillus xylanilyticus TaxID=582475 RepID=A0A2M9Q9F9_9BACI|nr:hypothetical protein CWD94_05070 [Lysinibacillus xylanilyticus]
MKHSISLLQRNLRNAYVRSGRLVDTLKELVVVYPIDDSKPLDVFVNYLEMSKIS